MRTIYTAVIAFFVACVLLFVGSILYMDKSKHKTYYYKFNLNGCDVGAIRVDKFRTEDRYVYKSSSSMPFLQDAAEIKEKITLSGNHALESYSKEKYYPTEIESIRIEKKDSGISFVSRSGPCFLCLEDIAAGKDPIIFGEDSPVTYLPLVEKYDFNEGGSQVFETLTVLSPELPPIKRIVVLTSVKDEYIKINGRKIMTEKLIMKIRNYPKGSIWVAKSDKAIIKIDSPSEGVSIIRTFTPYQPKPKPYPYTNDVYTSNNITIKSEGAELAGTLTTPKDRGKYPAIVLVWGDGPQDRGYQGLFDSIADYLSQKGVCVLRFDKRGIGSSTGSYLSYSAADQINDIKSAVEYLASCEYVDQAKIIIAGHAEGADIALRSVQGNDKIKSLIIMSPDLFFGEKERLEKSIRLALSSNLKTGRSVILEQYFRKTAEKTASTKGNWASALDRWRFLADARWWSEAKPVREVIKAIKLPVLIIQGRKDEDLYPECASIIDASLQEGGNNARVLAYYAYLGRFLGHKVSDGIHRAYYQTDREVLDGIIAWIKREEAPEPPKIDLT